jgi:hypoxanthine-DNA glycosylase
MKAAFPPLVGSNSKILILGTMPGEKSLALQQYYGNRGNHFWKLLYKVLNEPFTEDYEQRKKLLLDSGIALWDVLAYCEREGSLDSNIKNEQPNDFDAFYKMYPEIKTVFFSSKGAEKFYEKFAGRKDGIRYLTLPSPSGANAGKSFQQKLDEWRVITKFISLPKKS